MTPSRPARSSYDDTMARAHEADGDWEGIDPIIAEACSQPTSRPPSRTCRRSAVGADHCMSGVRNPRLAWRDDRRITALSSACCQGTMTFVSLIDVHELPREPLEALRLVARSEAELDELRWNQIAAARDAGTSWAAIGEALGVSRQSAWEYFTRRVREDLSANVASSDLTEDEAMDIVLDEVRASRRRRSGS